MTDKSTPEPEDNKAPEKEPAKLSFSLPQLLGSAAAAATVAYIGSSLGTAGTIFGAALASVIGALAGTVYTAGLDRTGRRLGSVMQRGWERIRRGDPELDETAEAPASERSSGAEPPPDKGRTWRHVAVRVGIAAAAIFAVAFVAITAWELITGQALDGGDGTTVGQVVRPERSPSAEPEPTPSETPTEASPAPSESPTPSPTPSESPTPAETPTETPTPVTPESTAPSPTATVTG